MKLNEPLIEEITEEAKPTRKLLEIVPADSFAWKPHDKSFTLGRLSSHVAEIFGWTKSILETDELDFAKIDYKPMEFSSSADMVKYFDDLVSKSLKCLEETADEEFFGNWTMRKGETIYFTMPKIRVLRIFAMNHLYHHRGQLTVYLRMLNIPLPPVYGPTADVQM